MADCVTSVHYPIWQGTQQVSIAGQRAQAHAMPRHMHGCSCLHRGVSGLLAEQRAHANFFSLHSAILTLFVTLDHLQMFLVDKGTVQ